MHIILKSIIGLAFLSGFSSTSYGGCILGCGSDSALHPKQIIGGLTDGTSLDPEAISSEFTNSLLAAYPQLSRQTREEIEVLIENQLAPSIQSAFDVWASNTNVGADQAEVIVNQLQNEMDVLFTNVYGSLVNPSIESVSIKVQEAIKQASDEINNIVKDALDFLSCEIDGIQGQVEIYREMVTKHGSPNPADSCRTLRGNDRITRDLRFVSGVSMSIDEIYSLERCHLLKRLDQFSDNFEQNRQRIISIYGELLRSVRTSMCYQQQVPLLRFNNDYFEYSRCYLALTND